MHGGDGHSHHFVVRMQAMLEADAAHVPVSRRQPLNRPPAANAPEPVPGRRRHAGLPLPPRPVGVLPVLVDAVAHLASSLAGAHQGRGGRFAFSHSCMA